MSTRLGRALGVGRLTREQRGSGPPRWVLDWKDSNGHRHREALSTDRRVAERRRAEIIRRRDLELAGLGSVEGQSMPLAELRDLYVADLEVRVGAKQLRRVRDSLVRLLGWLRARRVRDLIVADVMRYRVERLREGVGNRTVNIETASLRAMLNWAVSAQLIAENPIRALKPLSTSERHQRRVRRALSDDEIARLLAAADQDDIDCAARMAATRTITVHGRGAEYAARHRSQRVPQRILWQALLETGARWSELTSIKWADIEPMQRSLMLRAANTKAGRSRVIPLRQALVDELLELREVHQLVRKRVVQANDRVFLSPDGAHWDCATTGARRLFRRVLERAGIDRHDATGQVVDIHAMRVAAATRMARNNVPLVVTQRVLGHASPELTARVYTRLELENLRCAVETFDRVRTDSQARVR